MQLDDGDLIKKLQKNKNKNSRIRLKKKVQTSS